jgi:hypothetical protein
MRLFLVVEALRLPGRPPRDQRAFFVALTGIAPDGRPADAGRDRDRRDRVVGVLTARLRRPQTEALAIVLVDRAISVLSIIVLRRDRLLVSPLRRGVGITEAAPPKASGPR